MAIPHDYHVHTNHSIDCRIPMAEMCAAAVAAGIPEVGIADHLDLHPLEQPRSPLDIGAWSGELEECRERFRGTLVIRAGIEIGEPHRFWKSAGTPLSTFPFDYMLGSLHWVGSGNVFMPEYFNRSEQDAYCEYFVELERMTRAGGFDVLAHLDVPVRTGFGYYGGYDPSRYEAAIRAVLANLVERRIALEINTGTLRRSAAVLTPGSRVLEWYREAGGERITLGSDAHRAGHVGAGLPMALDVARAAGFRHVTRFERRQAQLVPID